ncbi:MAG TPA: hypothetical protein DCR93_22785 [Cytophagales bacterium]|nr:hypothetical protein [Cytophagales bacterium]HAP62202.1 hypothetical protein [Cytophagales bacterium]
MIHPLKLHKWAQWAWDKGEMEDSRWSGMWMRLGLWLELRVIARFRNKLDAEPSRGVFYGSAASMAFELGFKARVKSLVKEGLAGNPAIEELVVLEGLLMALEEVSAKPSDSKKTVHLWRSVGQKIKRIPNVIMQLIVNNIGDRSIWISLTSTLLIIILLLIPYNYSSVLVKEIAMKFDSSRYSNMKSPGPMPPSIQECNTGGDGGDHDYSLIQYDMGLSKGEFLLVFDLFSAPDNINVFNCKSNEVANNTPIYTYYGSGDKAVSILFSDGQFITVEVSSPIVESSWTYTVYCPSGTTN